MFNVLNIFKKTEYMQWNDYNYLITQLDDFLWRQNVRKQNIQNLPST